MENTTSPDKEVIYIYVGRLAGNFRMARCHVPENMIHKRFVDRQPSHIVITLGNPNKMARIISTPQRRSVKSRIRGPDTSSPNA